MKHAQFVNAFCISAVTHFYLYDAVFIAASQLEIADCIKTLSLLLLLQMAPKSHRWKQLSVDNGRFLVDFYPKFHCEFNFIEMFWAACKSFTRRNCSYSFKDLQLIVPLSLQNVELSHIRRFARKCYRYMDAYRLRDDNGNSLTPPTN